MSPRRRPLLFGIVAAANTPPHSRRKSFVPPPAQQIRRLTETLPSAAVFTLAEAHPGLARAAQRLVRYGYTEAPSNGPYPARNALLHRRVGRGRVSRRSRGFIRVPYDTYPKTGLQMAWGVYRRGGVDVLVVALHLPTAGSDRANQWRSMVTDIARSARSLGRANDCAGVVLAGDWNRNAETVNNALGTHWSIASFTGVMGVAVADLQVRRTGVVLGGYNRVVSDHPRMPWARVAARSPNRKKAR